MLIIKLSAIDSTNMFLKQWVGQTKEHTAIGVLAEHQTHGRGRMGTKWQSDKGLNLTGSVYLGNISLNNDAVFEINKRVCLAVLDMLIAHKIPSLQLKWPNDILSGNKKIGGILVEPILRGHQISGVIIGCGINVNQLEFPNLPCAASMRGVTHQKYNIETLFEDLAKNIETTVCATVTENDRYLDSLYGLNTVCSFKREDGSSFSATIIGVAKEGTLIVQHENGKQELFEEKKLIFTAFEHCR